MNAPSGEQFELRLGAHRVVVTEVGATLRCYELDGVPVCWGFDEDAIASAGRGQVLAPWPNRLEGGSYEFRGVRGRAALDEPERHNAIHGLVRWLAWRVEAHSAAHLLLACVLHPQPAYPFALRLELAYELTATGLSVTCHASNEGDGAAPFGIGFHPYLDPGPEGLDAASIELPARTRLVLDGRGLPVGTEPVVPGTGASLEDGASPGPVLFVLRDRVLDDCFTDLVRQDDGRWRVRLVTGDGRRPSLWADASFGYVMCFTADTLHGADRRRAVAIEPMSCPPNALRSGRDLVVLEPGEAFSASWGIDPGR